MGETGFARFDADERLVWANAAFAARFAVAGDATLDGLLGSLLGGAIADLRRGRPMISGLPDGSAVTLALGSGGAGEWLLTAVEAAVAGIPAERGPWAKTSSVLDCLSQGVMAFDRDLRLVAWNRRVLELLYIDPGFPRYAQPYEAVVRHIAEQGGYGRGNVDDLVAQRLHHIRKAPWPFYNERVRPDGVIIETVTLPLPDGGFVTTYTDITRRKQAERELASSRDLLEQAIRAAREGISQWDLHGGEVWFSPQWWGLLGYSEAEMDNSRRRWEELLHPQDRDAALEMVEELATGRRSESRQLQRFRHRSGQTIFLETRVLAVAGNDGRIVRIVGAHTDVTESVHAAEAVRAARDEAERALQDLKEAQVQLIQAEKMAALGSLVAGVTHEINTPVGIALTGASLLAEKTRALRHLFEAGSLRRGDFADYIDIADEATQLMLLNIERATRLIQSFKQIAVDQASEERRVFELNQYIHEILRSLGMRIRRSGHSVEVRCPDGLTLDSYPGAFGQILTNFVINSLLHGYEPGVRGRLTVTVTATGGEVELVYSDDGRGIPADLHGKIFEPFFTTSRDRGGSGLGLNIVYTLVTRTLRGRLRLESEPGAGTAFTLRFPRVTPADPLPL
ncbi:PAS domain-containing sensor histidine kinase [Azospirillum palustre]|uniref:histidine kinase n=1 Tax=Azospirillum palustre TaxID=2044885 RepID=A0A2B8BKJ4_9PROT|nr:PAS-domain containing protein [Azospirillum palustre]PGH58461.1 PAS domain-containing sensor histidine kinase [Azospirillum palustre]